MAFYDFKKTSSGGGYERIAIDNSALISGKYISENNGQEINASDWSATDFIEIEGTSLFFTGAIYGYGSNIYNAFYDENKDYVSRLTITNPDDEITIPSTAKYMRISCRTALFTSNHYFIG